MICPDKEDNEQFSSDNIYESYYDSKEQMNKLDIFDFVLQESCKNTLRDHSLHVLDDRMHLLSAN